MSEKETKAIAEAQDVCAQAYAEFAGYERFLRLLPQNKNIGSQEYPSFISVNMPYMQVDGRVKMLWDEHRSKGATVIMHPVIFEVSPDGSTYLARVTIESSLHGSASGTAKVTLGSGHAIDTSNPYECAETSAIGRALGFMGYGLVGTGIASFEEVDTAKKLREEKASDKKVQPIKSAPVVEAKPEVKPEVKVEAKVEAKPETKVEAKAEVKPEVKENVLSQNAQKIVDEMAKAPNEPALKIVCAELKPVFLTLTEAEKMYVKATQQGLLKGLKAA